MEEEEETLQAAYQRYQDHLEAFLTAEPDSEKEWINTLIFCQLLMQVGSSQREREAVSRRASRLPVMLYLPKQKVEEQISVHWDGMVRLPSTLFDKWMPKDGGLVSDHFISPESKQYMSAIQCSVQQSGSNAEIVNLTFQKKTTVLADYIRLQHTAFRRFPDAVFRTAVSYPLSEANRWLSRPIWQLTDPALQQKPEFAAAVNSVLAAGAADLWHRGVGQAVFEARLLRGRARVQRMVWAVHAPVAVPRDFPAAKQWASKFKAPVEISMHMRNVLFEAFALKVGKWKSIRDMSYLDRFASVEIRAQPVDITTFCIEIRWPPVIGLADRIPTAHMVSEPEIPAVRLPSSRGVPGAPRATEACFVCGANASYLCSGCRTALYCSEQCQQRDWLDAEHEAFCA
jgi:hypothetical protein